jgi:hypothetical protein
MKIYFLIYFLTLSLFGFLFYRSFHPTSNYSKITELNSFYASKNESACKFHIIGGIPNAPLPDGNIRINIFCRDGLESHNYFRLGAIKNPTISSVLSAISLVNNFTFPQNIKIKVNGEPSSEMTRNIKINDTIDVYLN